MPPWSEIVSEILELENSVGNNAPNVILQKYLKKLQEHTKRDTILYTTSWISPTRASDIDTITEDDLDGFMETVYGLKTKKLDLILHSPGGSPEVAEAMVLYLREEFEDIRVIIPHAAMSAATLISCASNNLVMGNHSFLGPTDPQMLWHTTNGWTSASAQHLMDEFNEAQKASPDNSSKSVAWVPILSQFVPGLLQQCKSAKKLTEELTRKWLEGYMFAGESNAQAMAARISEDLNSQEKFKSHSRHISKNECRKMGLKIIDLEGDPILQDLVLSVYRASNIFFQRSSVVKIIKNHNGRTVLKLSRNQ